MRVNLFDGERLLAVITGTNVKVELVAELNYQEVGE